MQKFSKQLLINYKQPTSHFNSLFCEEKSASHILIDPTLLIFIHTKKGQEKKMSSSNRRSSVFTSWPGEQQLKPFDEITRYYSDTMKIHVLSNTAQEILHHEINTYLSFGCTWRNGYRPQRLATMAGAVVLISWQNDQYYE